jgi:hypothetical protein
MWRKNIQSNDKRMVNISNIKRDIAIARINHCHFHYSSFNDRKLILVMCHKNVLIDTFVLDEVIRVIAEVAISA